MGMRRLMMPPTGAGPGGPLQPCDHRRRRLLKSPAGPPTMPAEHHRGHANAPAGWARGAAGV